MNIKSITILLKMKHMQTTDQTEKDIFKKVW